MGEVVLKAQYFPSLHGLVIKLIMLRKESLTEVSSLDEGKVC